MNSQELNARIREFDDHPEKCGGFDAFGGKPIPYVGWFWREVDFDREGTFCFGVIPACDGDGDLVGFMQDNKWGYPYVVAEPGQWEKIKALVVAAVSEPAAEKFEAVNDAIQGLLG